MTGCSAPEDESVLTVYSSRQPHLIEPLFDKYRAETGVQVRYVNDEAGALLHRLEAEGESTAGDLFLTVDAGNLWQAAESGYLQPVESDVLERNIPDHLQDPDNRWFGLSVRARTIVYSTERVSPDDLSTYEALAGEAWRNRLCLRTSKKVYNQSLVAMMIHQHGEPATEEVVRGWVRNLAAPPFANDVAVMDAIKAGQCDVGIVNSYYFGRMQKDDPDVPLALFWANQDSEGVHVNVSGGGVIAASDNPAAAKALLEWLSGDEAQSLFASLDLEYPANPELMAHPIVEAWGDFKPNPINVSKAGALQTEAVKLMERAGYR
ncbi:MAG: Fe(3+) ABC transporter substrate-binding protein [Salinisphaeraceae bacterium]|nr:Fe(3+) ABC transporter substrate-binding protein [Salinisphaeraceae bacterium]